MDPEAVRKLCLSLPSVTEDVKWGNDLVFSIGSKMFCVTSLEPPFRCSLKVKDEEFEELCSRPEFIPAPYMARAKWVQVVKPEKLNKKEWEVFIFQSHQLVANKLSRKLRISLGLQ